MKEYDLMLVSLMMRERCSPTRAKIKTPLNPLAKISPTLLHLHYKSQVKVWTQTSPLFTTMQWRSNDTSKCMTSKQWHFTYLSSFIFISHNLFHKEDIHNYYRPHKAQSCMGRMPRHCCPLQVKESKNRHMLQFN